MPYLLRISHISYPLYVLLVVLNAVVFGVSQLIRDQRIKQFLRTFVTHYIYVLQAIQATVFLPYLEIQFTRECFCKLLLLIILEVYTYTVYLSTDPFAMFKKDVLSLNKQICVFLGIVIDLSVVLSSSLLNVYFSFCAALISSTLVLSVMLTHS